MCLNEVHMRSTMYAQMRSTVCALVNVVLNNGLVCIFKVDLVSNKIMKLNVCHIVSNRILYITS